MAEHVNDVLALHAPVCEVTLLEDRARVVRRGTIELPAGLARVRVDGVAPVLGDKTLTGEIAGDGATVVDARVSRRLVVAPGDGEPGRDSDQAAASLEAELKAVDAELVALDAERQLVDRHAGGMEAAYQLTLAELAEDVAWGRADHRAWAEALAEVRSRERTLRERLVELGRQSVEKRRVRQRLAERVQALRKPVEREWAAIEAAISVSRAGSYTVSFEYVVPGACWRPYHTCRLLEPGAAQSGGPRVIFSTDACVWQSTGEDWDNVELVLSTERASLGTEPPPLASEILMVQRKSDSVVVQAREQEIQTTGLGAGQGAKAPAAAPELPGIDDGGAALHLRAPERASVPADGRPYRVRLGSFESPAEVELVAMAELVPCVIVKSVQTNQAGAPILAGPVDLIRQSGVVGRTSVMFIAAGERFELGWGPEPDLRIHRDTDVTEEKSRLLSSWVERSHEIELRLSNLGERAHTVKITERVPVSEIDKVRIEIHADVTTGGKSADENGFVTWHIKVPPHGHERVALKYTLKKHEDVIGL